MSAASSPSALQGPPRELDESRLPQGQCRYILLLPEIKGQRCACVNFSLNRAMPSATCDCGHLACYHVKTAEPTTDKHEVELLKQRIQVLEEQLDREREGSLGSVVTRVSELEELVDQRSQEASQRIDKTYQLISLAMNSIKQLESQTGSMAAQLSALDDKMQAVRDNIENRYMELEDADEQLDEKITTVLESLEDGPNPRGRQRRKSTSDSPPRGNQMMTTLRRRRSSTSDSRPHDHPFAPTSTTFREHHVGSNTSASWTAHISLLPSRNVAMPFEKDTNAYKRCLSRGLHQVVVIAGPDSHSFESAVTTAFGSLLRGRPWMPLQAKPCNAEPLQGLPMLRQLDSDLVDCDYDINFLKKHCAVCDPSGKIDSLYIAMRSDTLSWHFLRRSPIFKHGLEESWGHDPRLDPNGNVGDDLMDEDQQPFAGDIVPNLPSLPLKRAASEISRSSSFGSSSMSTECESSRNKMQRVGPHIPGLVESHRRAERVT